LSNSALGVIVVHLLTATNLARDADQMAVSPFAQVLRDYWTSDRPHHERLILTAAVISTALHREGMRATLVGGGAIELHAPGVYRTGDIDFVVEGRSRVEIDAVMQSLGLAKKGRHWVMDDLYVEVPGNEMESPVDVRSVDGWDLRVVTKESVLADRIVGFRHWKYWGYGTEAIALIRSFRGSLDEKALRRALRREGAEHAYGLLRRLAWSDKDVTHAQLDTIWHKHYR
jgi:hypothetical protein